jgi:hypothetical protein
VWRGRRSRPRRNPRGSHAGPAATHQ